MKRRGEKEDFELRMTELYPWTICERALLGFLLVTFCLLIGCRERDIQTQYGKRRGREPDSVNGTTVFAAMLGEAGHKVSTWDQLSPKLDRCQVIVWFPDDYDVPRLAERDYLERWLSSKPGRRLIYVGRDYNAAPEYWSQSFDDAPAEETAETLRRFATVRADHDQVRTHSLPKEEYARWFILRRDGQRRRVKALSGPWAKDIDATKAHIELESRLVIPTKDDIPKTTTTPTPVVFSPRRRRQLIPPTPVITEPATLPDFEPLLKSGDDLLVYKLTPAPFSSNEIIVVANGSFTLNLPLVNQENRKLAAKLVEECGPPGEVILLESKGPLAIRENEHQAQPPTGFELFGVWPLNLVLLHFVAVGILYCFSRFPIFGRPRALKDVGVSDFGNHLQALGELLEKTGDQAAAKQRLEYYQLHVKRDSGASHTKEKKPS